MYLHNSSSEVIFEANVKLLPLIHMSQESLLHSWIFWQNRKKNFIYVFWVENRWKFRGLIKGITSECHLFSFYNWQKYSPFPWSPRMVWRGVTIPDFLRFSRYKNSSLSTNKHLIVLCAGCGQVDTLYSEIRYHNNTYIIKLKRKEY